MMSMSRAQACVLAAVGGWLTFKMVRHTIWCGRKRLQHIRPLPPSVLTQAHVQHFKTKGWVAVPGFWAPKDVAVIRASLTLLQSRGRLANVATEGDGITHTAVPRNFQLCPLTPELGLFKALPLHERVAGAVSQLLCDVPCEGVFQYLSQTFWKPARHGLGTSWHQDQAYFDVTNARRGTAMCVTSAQHRASHDRIVSHDRIASRERVASQSTVEIATLTLCVVDTSGRWVAVHDATVSNGTIEVLDTTDLLEHRRDGCSDHHITCSDSVDSLRATPIELKAGGVLFFDFSVPHRTGDNATESARAAVAYHL